MGAVRKEGQAVVEYRFITYETLDDGQIVRLYLNRPEVRNAQNDGLVHELGAALLRAEADEAVRVVIIGGVGPAFSSGHDRGSAAQQEESAQRLRTTSKLGAEAAWLYSAGRNLDNHLRWRELRKITIAQVQGSCVSAGLQVAWTCDLIVAAENATFADVVPTRLHLAGAPFFAHPWELGPRKAMELLLTGDYLTAEDAYRIGMVNKVVPLERLEDETLNFARRIAQVPTMVALMCKESVKQAREIQGFSSAVRVGFSLHELTASQLAHVRRDGANDGRQKPGPIGRPIQRADKSSSGVS
jgi:enoyl-CoA hydratase